MNDNGRVPPDSPQWTGQVLKRSVTGPNKNYMVNPTYLSNPEKEGVDISKDVDDTLMVPVMVLGENEPQDYDDVIVHCVGNRFVAQSRHVTVPTGSVLGLVNGCTYYNWIPSVNPPGNALKTPLVGFTVEVYQGAGGALQNVPSKAGALIATGTTDATGNFAIPVPLGGRVIGDPPVRYSVYVLANRMYQEQGAVYVFTWQDTTITNTYQIGFDGSLYQCCFTQAMDPLPTTLYMSGGGYTLTMTYTSGSGWVAQDVMSITGYALDPSTGYCTGSETTIDCPLTFRFSCNGETTQQPALQLQVIAQFCTIQGLSGIFHPTNGNQNAQSAYVTILPGTYTIEPLNAVFIIDFSGTPLAGFWSTPQTFVITQ